jgi:uncharacterized membrane protein YdbT with pleckstrin-like domain
MGYVERNMISGETVVYRARLHWIVMLWPMVIAMVLAVAGLATIIVNRHNQDSYARMILWFGIGCLVLAAVALTVGIVHRGASEFAVTNKRVIVKAGLVHTRTQEMFLNKIESVGVDQTVWGRMLGFGSIAIHGTGGSSEPFHNISGPLNFRHQIQEQIGSIPN